MNIEYDKESDSAFIWVDPKITVKSKDSIANEIWPKESKEHIGLLFGEDKKLLGIEVLFASKYLAGTILK